MKNPVDEFTREDLDRLYFLTRGLGGGSTVAELNAQLEAAIAAGKRGNHVNQEALASRLLRER